MSDVSRREPRSHSAHAPYLYETNDGAVMHCACCGRVQIVFRDLPLLITVDAFIALRDTVCEAEETIGACSDDGAWRLTVDHDAGDTSVTLHLDELRALKRLLDGARAMMALRSRLTAVAKGAARDTVAT